jgi:pimeloyl-ACP methyl ester carboxylesterase
MVLQGTLTRDGLVRLPFEMDEFFRKTAAEAKMSPIAKSLDPDLESGYRRLREQLEREPLPVVIHGQSGDELRVVIGHDLFASLVATRTTDPRLPALLTSLANKDTSVIAPILQSIYQDLEKGAGNLMSHSVVCAATDAGLRLKMAHAQTSSSLLPEPFDNLMVTDEFCRRIGAGGSQANIPPPKSDVPVLFINGDLDDRTPLSLTQTAAKQFRHSQVIVVKNGGHELLPEERIQEMVTRYFSGDDPGESPTLPPRVFLSVSEAARPPQHPR